MVAIGITGGHYHHDEVARRTLRQRLLHALHQLSVTQHYPQRIAVPLHPVGHPLRPVGIDEVSGTRLGKRGRKLIYLIHQIETVASLRERSSPAILRIDDVAEHPRHDFGIGTTVFIPALHPRTDGIHLLLEYLALLVARRNRKHDRNGRNSAHSPAFTLHRPNFFLRTRLASV